MLNCRSLTAWVDAIGTLVAKAGIDVLALQETRLVAECVPAALAAFAQRGLQMHARPPLHDSTLRP